MARRGNYATDEITPARDAVAALRIGMLCLAGRFFRGYELRPTAARSGAELLRRGGFAQLRV